MLAIGFTVSVSLISMLATADPITAEEAELIDEGFRIFMEETFEGNGRTCGSCHVPSEQYTISPGFIATLSDGETDTLMASSVPGLENPTLVTQLALFNTGPGIATEEFPVGPFRSAQQVTAMNLTTLNFGGTIQMLGWDGGGSPSGGAHHGNNDGNADGSLRAFANGAIAQHATKTLARVAKTTACKNLIKNPDGQCKKPYDFRFATDAELDALEAFQRWLGRRAADETPGCGATSAGTARCTEEYISALPPGSKGEFTLDPFDPTSIQGGPAGHDMVFYDPTIAKGETIYQSDEASCFLCHQNGGAHFGNNGRPHGNLNRNQGIEDFRFDQIAATGINIPFDRGDGVTGGRQPFAFNVQTIIEAARRTHFGHNNAIVGFEAMVGEGFHKPFVRDLDPELGCDGIGIVGTGAPGREGLVGPSNDKHADSEACLEEVHGEGAVNKMAAFLRALSAWYSLRDAERFVKETCERIDLGVPTEVAASEAAFAFEDIVAALSGAQVTPLPHRHIVNRALKHQEYVVDAAGSGNKQWLKSIYDETQSMRDMIATTTQEGPRPLGVCE